MKVIAFIIDHAVVDKILRHIKRRLLKGVLTQVAWYARWCEKGNSYPPGDVPFKRERIALGT